MARNRLTKRPPEPCLLRPSDHRLQGLAKASKTRSLHQTQGGSFLTRPRWLVRPVEEYVQLEPCTDGVPRQLRELAREVEDVSIPCDDPT